ncbi:hypothetical protein HUT19_37470 [Streptomyces sp. NA02950]|uniref:hypothetical protein n=1 Tax=Streptomyces sp. NA02950 TaxID=2742137 RepID=UPI0015928B4D|nr:hypothetical protein [Streptomyces sp. NA02950]QKV96688.1 hypothetical protein HUT19_37470 [Streptomyces sp. NA02950]
MDIEWGSLGGVLGVSLGITVAVVVLFSLGIAAWSRTETYGERASATRSGVTRPGATRRGVLHRRPGTVAAATAAVCFAACLAVAAYGIDLIIPG